MEPHVRERLIGALVLVAAVVVLVPALLRGPPGDEPGPAPGGVQSVVVPVDPAPPAADDELVPEPAPAQDLPDADPAPVPRTTAAPTSGTPPPAAPAARAADAAPAWAVQLGAFSTRDKAEALVAQLKQRGYAAFVLEYRAGGRVLHRVRVGPEQDRDRAEAIAARLRKDGFQTVVAAHP